MNGYELELKKAGIKLGIVTSLKMVNKIIESEKSDAEKIGDITTLIDEIFGRKNEGDEG